MSRCFVWENSTITLFLENIGNLDLDLNANQPAEPPKLVSDPACRVPYAQDQVSTSSAGRAYAHGWRADGVAVPGFPQFSEIGVIILSSGRPPMFSSGK